MNLLETLRSAVSKPMVLFEKIKRESAENYARRARQFAGDGKHGRAVDLYILAIGMSPANAELRGELGALYFDIGKLEDAEKVFQEGLEIDEKELQALKGLGVILHSTQRLSEAAYYYLRYLEMEPKDYQVLLNLGAVMHMLGRYEDAIRNYEAALVENPRSLEVRANLANVYLALGNTKDALRVTRDGLELSGESVADRAEFHRLRGEAFNLLSKTDDALKEFTQSLNLDPESVGAHLGAALALSDLGRTEEGLRHSDRALEILNNGGDAESAAWAYGNLGWTYYKAGEWEKSIDASKRSIATAESPVAVQFNLALAMLHAGDVSAALDQYTSSALSVTDATSLKIDAINDLEEALRQRPGLRGGQDALSLLKERFSALSSPSEVAR